MAGGDGYKRQLEDFRWMTLGQIKELMHYDNMVNMDTRTVLSGLKISDYITPFDGLKGMSQFGKDMVLSSETNHAFISTRAVSYTHLFFLYIQPQ